MRVLIFRLLVLLPLYATATAQTTDQTLLIFGDSLSAAYGMSEEAGWVALLDARIERGDYPLQVINGSVSGETTSGGLARLPALLASYNPAIVLLELGGNDGLRGLPLQNIKQNLAAMIEMAQKSGAEVVLAGIQIPPNYGPRYTEPFFAQFAELAESYGVPLIPFLIDGIPQQPELMQADGIHPRAEAQEIIVENVWTTLKPVLSQVIREH